MAKTRYRTCALATKIFAKLLNSGNNLCQQLCYGKFYWYAQPYPPGRQPVSTLQKSKDSDVKASLIYIRYNSYQLPKLGTYDFYSQDSNTRQIALLLNITDNLHVLDTSSILGSTQPTKTLNKILKSKSIFLIPQPLNIHFFVI